MTKLFHVDVLIYAPPYTSTDIHTFNMYTPVLVYSHSVNIDLHSFNIYTSIYTFPTYAYRFTLFHHLHTDLNFSNICILITFTLLINID